MAAASKPSGNVKGGSNNSSSKGPLRSSTPSALFDGKPLDSLIKLRNRSDMLYPRAAWIQLPLEVKLLLLPSATTQQRTAWLARQSNPLFARRVRQLFLDCGAYCTNVAITSGRHARTLLAPADKRVQGWGLFAGQPALPGDCICEYTGELLSLEESDRRGQFYDGGKGVGGKSLSYLFDVKGQIHLSKGRTKAPGQHDKAFPATATIDALRVGNKSRFVNDSISSKGANVQPEYWRVNGVLRIGLFALKPIAAGEEYRFHYGYSEEEVHKFYGITTSASSSSRAQSQGAAARGRLARKGAPSSSSAAAEKDGARSSSAAAASKGGGRGKKAASNASSNGTKIVRGTGKFAPSKAAAGSELPAQASSSSSISLGAAGGDDGSSCGSRSAHDVHAPIETIALSDIEG